MQLGMVGLGRMGVITAALYERFQSRQLAAFTGQVLSAMRSEFGGHAERK